MVNIFFVLVERVSSCCRSTSIITLLHGRNGPCHRTMELRSWNTLSKASKLQNFDFVLWKHIIFGYVWCPWALSDTDVCPIPFLIWHSASPIIIGVLLVATMDNGHESSHVPRSFVELTAVAFFAIEACGWCPVAFFLTFINFHHVLHRFSRHLSPGRLLGDWIG